MLGFEERAMSPLRAAGYALLWLNDAIWLASLIIQYFWHKALWQQGSNVPTEWALKPMIETQSRIMLLAPELGLMKPYLQITRTVAEVKKWRKI